MIDIESTLFDRVADAFDSAFPNGSRYGQAVEFPAAFPCLTMVEVDNYTYEDSLTASMQENGAWIVYEVDAFSSKPSGAKQECKAMIALADSILFDAGFTRVFCRPLPNQDDRIYRMKARYRAVVSKDYRVYRR